MRVSSIPSDLSPVKQIEVKLPEAMASTMRLSFLKEGDTFQAELKQKARQEKVDLYALYTSLMFWRVFEPRAKKIEETEHAQKWAMFYSLTIGASEERKHQVADLLGLQYESKK